MEHLQPLEVKDLFVLMVNLAKERYVRRMGVSEIIIEKPKSKIENPPKLILLGNRKIEGQTLH